MYVLAYNIVWHDNFLLKRFINDSEAFRQEERDKITEKRIAMAKYVEESGR